MKRKDLAELLSSAAAFIESPIELNEEEKKHLIEDLRQAEQDVREEEQPILTQTSSEDLRKANTTPNPEHENGVKPLPLHAPTSSEEGLKDAWCKLTGEERLKLSRFDGTLMVHVFGGDLINIVDDTYRPILKGVIPSAHIRFVNYDLSKPEEAIKCCEEHLRTIPSDKLIHTTVVPRNVDHTYNSPAAKIQSLISDFLRSKNCPVDYLCFSQHVERLLFLQILTLIDASNKPV